MLHFCNLQEKLLPSSSFPSVAFFHVCVVWSPSSFSSITFCRAVWRPHSCLQPAPERTFCSSLFPKEMRTQVHICWQEGNGGISFVATPFYHPSPPPCICAVILSRAPSLYFFCSICMREMEREERERVSLTISFRSIAIMIHINLMSSR